MLIVPTILVYVVDFRFTREGWTVEQVAHETVDFQVF